MRFAWIFGAAMALPILAADAQPPKVYGGAQMQEVYRIRLDRDDLLLETILDTIKKNDIQDGAVLTGVGSVSECNYHAVASTGPKPVDAMKNVKGPIEILNLNGIIAAGEPHLHITLSNDKGAFGGHLENNCRVAYRGEVVIVKFSGKPLARKPNAVGTPALQAK